MKKGRTIRFIAITFLVGVFVLGGVGSALAEGPWGRGGRGGMMGGFGGGGMMGGNGSGGMMGGFGNNGVQPGNGLPGMMEGSGTRGMMGGTTWQTPTNGTPITIDQAVQSVKDYVANYGNADLAVDEVMEFQNNFYGIVKEKSTGTGAFEVLVNKDGGAAYPEMGPNMMWNNKYGMMSGGLGRMMSGMMGGSFMHNLGIGNGPMTVTPEQAAAAAQRWLDQNQPGTTTETPDQFYGYYTVHTLKNGQVNGMLSVNGYTGQVWYHTWHGDFVQKKELDQ